jgi:predicted glycoside hydrolase/deacetylase ChbG (UPF0249 family)
MRAWWSLSIVLLLAAGFAGAEEPTYAERLGWPKGSRVLMIHADDLGMSHASNLACIATFEAGTVTSGSVMMPCSWTPGLLPWIKKNPEACVGVHLTLTAEWDDYRWSPVAGREAVPGLVDAQGFMHDNVAAVVANATADEVETEIRAQIALAEKMGFSISHIDSHMGTLYASQPFFERYLKVAVEKQIPLLIAGGHLTIARVGEGEALVAALQQVVPLVWNAGLPVLDDIDTRSYSWDGLEKTDEFIQAVRDLKPGVTWLNVHPTLPTEEGKAITANREKLFGDYLALIDPALKKAIEDEGVILTSWRELMARRAKAK